MRWDASTQLSLAAVTMAGMSLVISLFAAFPGLKGIFSVVRDGVLWLAVLIILSGAGFVVYQRLQNTPGQPQRTALSELPGRELINREPAPRPMIPESRQP